MSNVYFARHRETQLVKIGFGQPPPDLQLEETTPGTRNTEARAHNLAENFHVRGDWYDLDREQIADLARGYLIDREWFLARWRTE